MPTTKELQRRVKVLQARIKQIRAKYLPQSKPARK
jgi:hypothetical protein